MFKRMTLAITPDFLIDFTRWSNKWLAKFGVINKPKPIVKETKAFVADAEEIAEEVSSLDSETFGIAEPLMEKLDLEHPDWDDRDECMGTLQEINERLSECGQEMLNPSDNTQAVEQLRLATTWGVLDAKGFVEACHDLDLLVA